MNCTGGNYCIPIYLYLLTYTYLLNTVNIYTYLPTYLPIYYTHHAYINCLHIAGTVVVYCVSLCIVCRILKLSRTKWRNGFMFVFLKELNGGFDFWAELSEN